MRTENGQLTVYCFNYSAPHPICSLTFHKKAATCIILV